MSYLGDLFFTWINKLRKKNKVPVYHVDWDLTEIIDPDSDPISGIKILTGQFKDLVYHYTYVKVLEDPAQQSATIKFGYNIVYMQDKDQGTKDQMEYLMFQILQYLIDDKNDIGEYVLPAEHYSEQMNAET